MKYYRAEIEDDNFEMILADSEEDAINQYLDVYKRQGCGCSTMSNASSKV